MHRSTALARLTRLVLIASLAAAVSLAVGPATHPTVVRAGTADTMESSILGWINAERGRHGLVPLRLHTGLIDLAGDRAAYMASIDAMQHISCLSCTFAARGIQWYSGGEVIAENTYPWGTQSAQVVFQSWMNSASHRAILMSNTFNYIGIGVAYRSSNHTTYASAVLTESKDRTRPWAHMVAGSHSGTTVTWSWAGADTQLQTHTAGLRNFDVQYRVDSGLWITIRSGTTARSLSLTSRTHGHAYSLRVRARDNLGYVSNYSAAIRIWVP